MNQKGFTLVELLTTIVILSIVVGITIIGVNGGFSTAKDKTEEIFIKTLEDALNIYIDSDAKKLSFTTSSSICTLQKRFGKSKVYGITSSITLNDIINSEYIPLVKEEVVNPANEEVACNLNAPVSIYHDDDYVYYYRINKEDLECLKTTGYITNLPSGCLG